MQFDQAIRMATTMRCSFSTKEGRIGLGLLVVLEGDRMFILDGGKASFILRRFGRKLINRSMEECFEFVGNFYVHTIMNRDTSKPWRSGYVYLL